MAAEKCATLEEMQQYYDEEYKLTKEQRELTNNLHGKLCQSDPNYKELFDKRSEVRAFSESKQEEINVLKRELFSLKRTYVLTGEGYAQVVEAMQKLDTLNANLEPQIKLIEERYLHLDRQMVDIRSVHYHRICAEILAKKKALVTPEINNGFVKYSRHFDSCSQCDEIRKYCKCTFSEC